MSPVIGSRGSASSRGYGQFGKLSEKIVETNLVLHLDAGNTTSYSGSGTVWYDLSASSNHMTFESFGSWASAGQSSYFNFNSGNYFRRSTFSNFNSSNFTYLCWLYPTSTAEAVISGLSRNSSDADSEYEMYVTGNGTCKFWDYQNGYGFQDVRSSFNVPLNSWSLIGFSKSGTTGKWYLNGTYYNTVTAALNAQYGTNDYFSGKDYRDNLSFFTGRMAKQYIYGATLTDAQILQNFNATKSLFGL